MTSFVIDPEADEAYINYWKEKENAYEAFIDEVRQKFPIDSLEMYPHMEETLAKIREQGGSIGFTRAELRQIREDIEAEALNLESDSSDDEDFEPSSDEDPVAEVQAQVISDYHKREAAIPNLDLSHISPEIQQRHTELWNELTTKATLREQFYLLGSLKLDKTLTLSWDDIGAILHRSGGTAEKHFKRGIDQRDPNRPPKLNQAQKLALFEFIDKCYTERSPATYSTISVFTMTAFSVWMSDDAIRKLVSRSKRYKIVTGLPMEEDRINLSQECVSDYYDLIEQELPAIPAWAICDIDESGYQSMVDSRKINCVVPLDFPEQTINVPVDAKEKRSTLLAGIFADGTYLKPTIVVPRKTVEIELYHNGYTPDKVQIYTQENGFFEAGLFGRWAEEVLIPEVEKRRAEHEYKGAFALLMDGASVHNSDWFDELCFDHGIFIIILPAHSTEITQPLDLVIFAVAKALIRRIHIEEELNKQTQQIIKMINSYHQACTISNILSAFQAAGITHYYDLANNTSKVRVSRENARRVMDFLVHGILPTGSNHRIPLDGADENEEEEN